MFSKVVTGVLLATLVVALIGGSAYILFRSNDRVIAQGEGGYNQRSAASASRNGSNNDGTQASNGYQGGPAARGEGSAESGQAGNGYQGGQQAESRGQGNEGAGQAGGAQEERIFENAGGDHPVDTWMTIEGRVVSLVDDELTIETADGELTIHTGPEWYWESEGIAIEIGDQVEASGFYDEETFELAKLENITTGQTVLLRDETGRPFWAGRGGQGGQGQGQGYGRSG